MILLLVKKIETEFDKKAIAQGVFFIVLNACLFIVFLPR
jgi:hypothetical protein